MNLEGESEIARHSLSVGRTLVWRDDGSPYDNLLHVYLLGPHGEVLDALEVGAALTTGLLEIRRVQGAAIDFTFFANDTTYRLQVDEKPRLRLPWFLPLGFRYKSKFVRHVLSVTTLKGGPAHGGSSEI